MAIERGPGYAVLTFALSYSPGKAGVGDGGKDGDDGDDEDENENVKEERGRGAYTKRPAVAGDGSDRDRATSNTLWPTSNARNILLNTSRNMYRRRHF
jgi:hypothetical protein